MMHLWLRILVWVKMTESTFLTDMFIEDYEHILMILLSSQMHSNVTRRFATAIVNARNRCSGK